MVYRYSLGQFSNQLYYCLQSYINNSKYSIKHLDQNIKNKLILFGCEKLLTYENYQKYINSYCQIINSDFTLVQLNDFIKNIILNSYIYKNKIISITNNIAIHIRNTDYLNPKLNNYHDCFDRTKYIIDTCKIVNDKYPFLKTLHIFSDDCKLTQTLYDKIFKDFFINIKYHNDTTDIQDFYMLSMFKYKILWNSTFSFWSAFISNIIYEQSEKCIFVPELFNIKSHSTSRCNPLWNYIQVIKK